MLHPNSRQVIGLFEPTQRYVIPMFQRHYVWTQTEQWEPLWEDICDKLVENKKPDSNKNSPARHFLGAIILDSTRSSSTKEVRKFLVIDGQQRLITLQLLLAALRDYANYIESRLITKPIDRCLLNPDTELMENPEEEKFKLWPTLLNRESFCKIITAGSADNVKIIFPVIRKPRKRKPEPRERLVEAYEYFYSQIEEMCSDLETVKEKEDCIISIYALLRDNFTMVEIILDDEDDAQEIFNSLNARGTPLSQSDLLRSYIFMRAEKKSIDRDYIFNTYWSRFESSWWDAHVRRGNIYSSRLDNLIRMILNIKLGTNVDVRRVHSAYANWMKCEPYCSIDEELLDIVNYAAHYKQLLGEEEGLLSNFGVRVGVWDTSTVFPLAMFLATECKLDKEELDSCLLLIESFIVRRSLCGLITKEYNKYFTEIIFRLRNTGISYNSLAQIFSTAESETRRFPDNDELEKCWMTLQFYAKFSYHQMAHILLRLEAASRSKNAEYPTLPSTSIEHVLPNQWHENYPIKGIFISKDMLKPFFSSDNTEEDELYKSLFPAIQDRLNKIDTIGNLTLIADSLNFSMRNISFSEKKVRYRESVLALNRYFDDKQSWDEDAIATRTRVLLSLAISIWPTP